MIKLILIIFCLGVIARPAYCQNDTYVDQEGVVHINIKGEDAQPTQTNTLPSWKDEVKKFCDNAINSKNLSDYKLNELLKESEMLISVAETSISDPSYKLATLKLIRDCRSAITMQKDIRNSTQSR